MSQPGRWTAPDRSADPDSVPVRTAPAGERHPGSPGSDAGWDAVPPTELGVREGIEVTFGFSFQVVGLVHVAERA